MFFLRDETVVSGAGVSGGDKSAQDELSFGFTLDVLYTVGVL